MAIDLDKMEADVKARFNNRGGLFRGDENALLALIARCRDVEAAVGEAKGDATRYRDALHHRDYESAEDVDARDKHTLRDAVLEEAAKECVSGIIEDGGARWEIDRPIRRAFAATIRRLKEKPDVVE